MDGINFNGVENIPLLNASVAFTSSSSVFREDKDIQPIKIKEKHSYMPWGSDNQMPFEVLDLIEKDETLSTCQMFNAEVCYGSGIVYNTDNTTASAKEEIEDFFLFNSMPSYFLGVCQDFKHFGFAVSVIILDKVGKKILHISRKEACYCRLAVADKKGEIPYVYYANWRNEPSADEVEIIKLLSPSSPWEDLQRQVKETSVRKYAIITRVPTADSTYYPIPYYGSLFRSKWYNIKQLIAISKEAKLKNSAPLKYHIEISNKYFDNIFASEHISSTADKLKRIKQEKQNMIDFITGAHNSGKVLFSQFYKTPDGKESQDVRITKIDDSKEGGDWESDIQEAINIICFTMRVHSNLVGSVPGKAQSNNSGSDKRELYTIAQALQKPYHDLLFLVHRIIIKFNGWKGAYPDCPFIMLSTLDENKDAKLVSNEPKTNKDDTNK